MTIDNLKELQKLINLCRKAGVDIIKVDGIELVLGKEPVKATTKVPKSILPTIAPGGITEDTQIEMPDDLSPEQLLFYSATSNEPVGQ